MPKYRTLQRLESRVDGKKQIIPSGSVLELSESEAQELGAVVELIAKQEDATENNSSKESDAGNRKSGKKTDSDTE